MSLEVIIPQQFFGLRDAAAYLTDTHGVETTYENLVYHIKVGRMTPRIIGERFPVLSRAQLDDYAKNGETKITIPDGVIVNRDQAAEMAGESIANFRRCVYLGYIPVHVINRKWAFNVADIPDLIERQRSVKPGPKTS